MNKFYSIIDSPSISSISERLALSSIAATLGKDSVIVEVGTEQGGSAKILSESSQATLYTIDIGDHIYGSTVDRSRFIFFQGNAKAFKNENPDLNIDFLYIDGDHSFGGVREDFDTLYAMLKPGGIIAFHDVDYKHLGVLVFVETLKLFNVITDCILIDTMVIARKPESIRKLEAYDFTETIFSLGLNYKPLVDEECFRINTRSDSTYYIGRGFMGRAGSLLLDIEFKKFIHSADASDKMGTYYIFSDFIKEITVHLVYKKKVMPENIYKINDKTLSSLAWNDIKIHGGKRFMQFATSRLEREILAGFFVEDTRNVGNLLLNNGFIGYFLRSFFNNV